MAVNIKEIESPPLLSIQNALSAAMGFLPASADIPYWLVDEYIFLFKGGCMLDDGSNNCTTVCLNATLAFRNTSSIQNCLIYPVISRLVASNNLSSTAADLANRYGIAATANTSAINQTLTTCFNEACGTCSNTFDFCPDHGTPQDNWSSFSLDDARYSQLMIGCVPDICSSIDASVHPDIGGIGTFYAYFMQTGIALFAWVLLRFFDTWTRNFVFCFTCPFGLSRARQIAVACQEKIKSSGQHAALKTGLVEFHKAQCYFMLTFQFAALVALGAGLQMLDPKSYQQLSNNVNLVGDISIGGFLPVTFVLFCLHSEGMKSWYAFILSTVTVFTSIATLVTVSNFEFRPDHGRILPGALNGCGGNQNPTRYCLTNSGTSGLDFRYFTSMSDQSGAGPPLSFSLVVLALLFVDQCELFCRKDDDGKEKRVNSYVCLKMWIKSWPMWRRVESLAFLKWIWLDTAERAIRFGTAVILLTIEVLYLVFLSYFLSGLVNIFHSGTYPSYPTSDNWSFGQIIAVTIWLPSIVEYIYLALRGMSEGSKYRIPMPYYVVKDVGGQFRSDGSEDSLPEKP